MVGCGTVRMLRSWVARLHCVLCLQRRASVPDGEDYDANLVPMATH
jgi:hypothetical protein